MRRQASAHPAPARGQVLHLPAGLGAARVCRPRSPSGRRGHPGGRGCPPGWGQPRQGRRLRQG
eukprot:2477007-Alexandrium_andersonii.AAC.1